jgi:hypothetical protein
MSGSFISAKNRCRIVVLALGLLLGLSTLAAAQDPLGQLFRDLFGGASGRTLDLIDRHAPAAPRELSRALEQCQTLVANRQWAAAVERLQELIDLPDGCP